MGLHWIGTLRFWMIILGSLSALVVIPIIVVIQPSDLFPALFFIPSCLLHSQYFKVASDVSTSLGLNAPNQTLGRKVILAAVGAWVKSNKTGSNNGRNM